MDEKQLEAKDIDKESLDGFAFHDENATTDREPYGPPGLRGLVANPFVFLCAACSTLGGLVFGYDQGVVSVILVMDQFQEQFPQVAPGAPGGGFWKGLMTAMIELGALVGALNQGWIADKISRRYSIVVAVVVFTIGSVLQTAAMNYAMLTVARTIGGIGIGMLSMVAPLYISEISTFVRHFNEAHPLTVAIPRSSRMSWYAASDGGILYRAGNRHRILDHIRYTIHGRRMVLATPFPVADGPWVHPGRRCGLVAVLSQMARFQGEIR